VPAKPRNVYAGKTYNSSEAIAEFFKKKGASAGSNTSSDSPAEPAKPSGYDKLKAISTGAKNPQAANNDSGQLVAGSHVRHDKYGRGLVLRREGSGDNVKLTVSFPGFGQKKLIEKYANLQKDRTQHAQIA
jgi:DNA helicase-2/ATP-dependent DNA helicase PcrA